MYYTRQEAEEAAQTYAHKLVNQYARIYKCEYCPAWHLTHKKRYRW